MAGFFGMPKYAKAGKGISKDGKQKKTFVIFFETFYRNFWKFVPISFIFSVISLPVLSSGIASVGLTHVARNTALDRHSFGLSDFIDTIKANWKQALIAGIINTVVYALLIFDVFIFYGFKNDTIVKIGVGLCLFLILTFTVMNYYIWTLMITFNLTLKQIYSNSFKFVFLNLKNNVICLFVNILYFAVNILFIYLIPRYFVYVFGIELLLFVSVYPGFSYLVTQYCVFPSIKKYAIDPYYKEHPDADIEKRKELGFEVDESKNTTEEDQNVFND